MKGIYISYCEATLVYSLKFWESRKVPRAVDNCACVRMMATTHPKRQGDLPLKCTFNHFIEDHIFHNIYFKHTLSIFLWKWKTYCLVLEKKRITKVSIENNEHCPILQEILRNGDCKLLSINYKNTSAHICPNTHHLY